MLHTTEKSVANHYTVGDLKAKIQNALKELGKDPNNITVDDLAPVDEFHIRGRIATSELAAWSNLTKKHKVLDIGSGLGGTSRYLASNFGCVTHGIDLTQAYCDLANELSKQTGIDNKTTFRQANALALPFADDSYDVAWTEHVQMNIEDKKTFYQEIMRVLKPGGKLLFHDIFAGPNQPIHFPVPWAFDASISHLIDLEELRSILEKVGLKTIRWEEKTTESRDFFETVLEHTKNEGPMPLGIHLLMGNNAKTKISNIVRNLSEERIQVVQAVLEK